MAEDFDLQNDDEYRKVGSMLGNVPPDVRAAGLRAMTRFEALNPGARQRAIAKLTGGGEIQDNPLFDEHRAEQAAQASQEDDAAARSQALQFVPPEKRELAQKAVGALKLGGGEQQLALPGGDLESTEALQQLNGEAGGGKNKLQSLSGRPELYAPPEYAGEAPGSLGERVSRFVAGDRWHEPPVEVAQRYLIERGMPEDQAKQVTTSSDAYKEFADGAWRQAYEKAVGSGRPLTRTDQAPRDTLGKKLSGALGDLSEGWTAFRGGVRNAVIPGSDQAIDSAEGAALGAIVGDPRGKSIEARANLQEAKANHPVLRIGGGIAGSFLPSPVGGVARRAAGAVAGPAGGLARRMAGGAVGGAAGGALQGGAERLVERGLNRAQGIPQDESIGQAALGTGRDALIGGAFGLAGQGVGEAAGKYRNWLREGRGQKSDALRKAEAAGYETSVVSGFKRGPEAQARVDAARAEGHTPIDVAAREAQPYLEKGARDLEDTTEARHGEEWGGYLKTKGGKTPVSTQPLLDRVLEELKGRKDIEGENLPFVESPFKKHALGLMELEVLPADAPAPKKSRARGEGQPRVYSVLELEQMGFTPDELAAKIPPLVQEVPAQGITKRREIGSVEANWDLVKLDRQIKKASGPERESLLAQREQAAQTLAEAEAHRGEGYRFRGQERLNTARERVIELERELGKYPDFPRTESEIETVSEAAAKLQAAREEMVAAQRELGSVHPPAPPRTREQPAMQRRVVPTEELLKDRDTRIVVRAAKKDAREIDAIQASLDEKAKLNRAVHGDAADPAYTSFAGKVREVRDKLPRNVRAPASLKYQVQTDDGPIEVSGPSALKARQHVEKRDVENTLGHAGFPSSLPEIRSRPIENGRPVGPEQLDLTANQQKALTSAITAYETTAPGSLHRDHALRTLAGIADSAGTLAEARKALNLVSGVRFGEEVRGDMSPKEVPASHSGWVRGVGRAVSLRADPVAAALASTPITPGLRSVLNAMRGGRSQRVGLAGHALGMRGGEVGRRAVAADHMDETDIKNLKRLLEASQ
jgi:hypothetical protein